MSLAVPSPRPLPEALILDVLCVLLDPIPWKRLSDAVRVVARRRRQTVPKNLETSLKSLVAQGLVEAVAGGYRAPRRVADATLASLVAEGGVDIVEGASAIHHQSWYWSPRELQRKLRLALFEANDSQVRAMLRSVEPKSDDPVLLRLRDMLSDLDWLDYLPRNYQRTLVVDAAAGLARTARAMPELDAWFETRLRGPEGADLAVSYGERLILQGQAVAARALLKRHPAPMLGFLLEASAGQTGGARLLVERMASGTSWGALGPSLLPLALVRENELGLAGRVVASAPLGPSVALASWLVDWRRGRTDPPPRPSDADRGWPLLVYALCLYWSDDPGLQEVLPALKAGSAQATRSGYAWLSQEMKALAATIRGTASASGLAAFLPRAEGWRRALAGLRHLTAAPPEPDERVVWMVNAEANFRILQPLIQKRSKRGGWTPGRQVDAFQVLREPCATEPDRRAAEALTRVHGYDPDPDFGAALAALAGQPNLLNPRTGDRIDLVEERPALRLSRQEASLRVSPATHMVDRPYLLEEQSPTRAVLYRMADVHRQLARLLRQGVEFPVEAEAELQDLLGGLAAHVPIHSDVPLAGQILTDQPADPTLFVLLHPEGDGLRALLRVRPLGETGAWLEPGAGAAVLTGPGVQTLRDLSDETQRAEALHEACPSLAGDLSDPQAALEALAELAARPAGLAELLWPEGETLRVQATAGMDDLRLRLSQGRDWFSLEGEAQIDEGAVLELRRLLEHARSSESRFVALGDGKFLALSRGLRRRLDELADLATPRGNALEVHPLAGLAVEEMRDELGSLQTDSAWEERLERMRRALAMKPRLPKALQAELRDYQAAGYRWLVRMASWGTGACLADDMGLGKTVQTLALLLQRADRGPSLVVAPTSVCSNWAEEAARFAPTLRVRTLGEGDREAVLDEAEAGDLILVSYGLLSREVARLEAVSWGTVILDEAQAIKNPATRRFQAAVRLQAEFRLATTGTPVENRLDELWALFRFLNHGLLGSRERFHQRFGVPVESGDEAARHRLQRLVRPFLLRRTKDEVLKELPPRTEVVLHVEPDTREVALYEALRRQALARLESGEVERFQILAELMRLRRAACHPRLVAPDSEVPSSKLQLFRETLDELLAEGHRALVFSQFVDHLTLVREDLDARGITYQYLDGSTPAKARPGLVKAFQAGEGQVFLISLRAGGFGLNLTGADYVLHLDPWWNPAVEDQASDRAHRIGQKRPVTVYRLVTRGTIEEKIVRMHADKRQLAEGLLSGADTPGAVPVDELLRLLREG